jgi:transcription factor WhiB
MTDQLDFLMPSRSTLPDRVTPQASVPGRPCAPYLNGSLPRPAGPVLLGYPVRTDCPAKTHNTLHAAREYPRGKRCICPGARIKKEAHRVKDKAAQAIRNAELKANRVKVTSPRPPLEDPVVQAILSAAPRRSVQDRRDFLMTQRVDPLMPACKVEGLGGTLPVWQADDFFDETNSIEGARARARSVAICHQCPIQYECLTAAVERNEAMGVWGGLTAKERRDPRAVAAELRAINREVTV